MYSLNTVHSFNHSIPLSPPPPPFRLKPNERVMLPRNRIRYWSYRISINSAFDNFMMFVVMFNLGVLAASHYDMSEEQILLGEQV